MDSDINKTVGVPAPTVTSIDVPTRERLHMCYSEKTAAWPRKLKGGLFLFEVSKQRQNEHAKHKHKRQRLINLHQHHPLFFRHERVSRPPLRDLVLLNYLNFTKSDKERQ